MFRFTIWFLVFSVLTACMSGCSGGESKYLSNANTVNTSIIDKRFQNARPLKANQTYKALEPVTFDVLGANSRRDVYVKFDNAQGGIVEQQAILASGTETYTLLIHPSLPAVSEKWQVSFSIGEFRGELGEISVTPLPDLSGAVAPGEISLIVQQAFVDSLSSDIQTLADRLSLSNHSPTDREHILQTARQLLNAQVSQLNDLNDLVHHRSPVLDKAGNVIMDVSGLTASDHIYVALINEFTAADIYGSFSPLKSMLRDFDADIQDKYYNFAGQIIDALKDSAQEAGGRAGNVVGGALLVGGLVASASASTTLVPAIAVAGALTFAVTTYVPVAISVSVEMAADNILGREPSIDPIVEGFEYVARRACQYTANSQIGVPIGESVCSAAEEVLDTAIEMVEDVGDYISDALEMDTNYAREENRFLTEDTSSGTSVDDLVESCDSEFGEELCSRYSYDMTVIYDRALYCCNISRDNLLQVISDFRDGLYDGMLPTNECELDLESFRQHYVNNNGNFQGNFDVPDVSSILSEVYFDGSDPEAHLNEVLEQLIGNIPSC